MFELRDYQKTKAAELKSVLSKFGVAYLTGEVRTGKTLIALSIVKSMGRCLFLTKKKAMGSIQSDVNKIGMTDQHIYITNYEMAHKIDMRYFKIVVLDEAHCLGQFPKPGKRTKALRDKISGLPCILLSGTPSPESYSQLFHQLWVTGKGPWAKYKKFYSWAKDYVNVRKQFVGFGLQVNMYDDTKPEVQEDFKPYCVSLTQQEAGFDGTVVEKIHYVQMPVRLYSILAALKKDRLASLREGYELVADTGAMYMSLVHQVSSGTVLAQRDGDIKSTPLILSTYKIDYIKEKFAGKRIAIFYVYVAEGELLKKAFHMWTDRPENFRNYHDTVFICQVSAGREGINLSTADAIVFFNISYSAVSYWQARARSQSQKGGDREVHWIFSKSDGIQKTIEQKIYDVVVTKKNFTLSHFNKTRASISKRK